MDFNSPSVCCLYALGLFMWGSSDQGPQMAWGAWFKNDETFIISYVPKNIM